MPRKYIKKDKTIKLCSECNMIKPRDSFYSDPGKQRLRTYCQDCDDWAQQVIKNFESWDKQREEQVEIIVLEEVL